ncbi:hypothetical protein OPV22_021172 [Ensete ventricosum]|uniref:IST1-like protein n=1 Tax=Ensete ventricosum TaxID=4639 RepID=A0AAV8QPP4_ENSVE|nr:hypothetical protein OPV22_021172 [Ensete ventricosum]
MSMLDAFFNKGFKGAKCKTLLKLTIPRIKLLRNRREIQLKQMRKDIAKLLENGQEATARIRVEHIIREENMMAAQEILELFCELITVRLPIIETQRECPLDLKEAISSICFAAPRCADLPELQQVQMLFAAKYGKEFVMATTELLPDCGVNRQIIELLSIRAPSVEVKLKLLKEIAEEHELDWDPSTTETEFLKPHEDLLNGPNHFTNGSTLPLPPEKHDALSSDDVDESHTEPDSEADFDSLDLPEVPKDSVRAALDVPSASGNVSNLPSSTHDLGLDHQASKSIPDEDMPHVPSMAPGGNDLEPSIASSYNHPNMEHKQFVPFAGPPSSFSVSAQQNELLPPSLSSMSESLKPSLPAHSPPPSSSVSLSPKQSEPALSPPLLSSFPDKQDQNEPPLSHPLLFPVASSAKHSEQVTSAVSSASLPPTKNESAASLSRAKSEINVDLQDILAAAQAAAETAEHAAIAARAAANLAQVRITDLATKWSNRTSESCGDELQGEGSEQANNSARLTFLQQYSFGSNKNLAAYGQEWKPDSPTLPCHERSSQVFMTRRTIQYLIKLLSRVKS